MKADIFCNNCKRFYDGSFGGGDGGCTAWHACILSTKNTPKKVDGVTGRSYGGKMDNYEIEECKVIRDTDRCCPSLDRYAPIKKLIKILRLGFAVD